MSYAPARVGFARIAASYAKISWQFLPIFVAILLACFMMMLKKGLTISYGSGSPVTFPARQRGEHKAAGS